MWYDLIDQTEFVRRIYDIPPKLNDVYLSGIAVSASEKKLQFAVVLQQCPDNPPPKWKVRKGNSVKIEMTFWCISNLNAYVISGERYCNIAFAKTADSNLQIQISGAITTTFIAEAGAVSNVDYVMS